MLTAADETSRRTLLSRFDPRSNSLAVLRLALAATVAVVHARSIGWGDQPEIGQTQVGELAVDGFFVVSGFLVTRSALRLGSIRRYAWHRALRIMPGFWACLLVVAFVAAPLIAWSQGRSPAVALTGPESSFDYVVRNAALLVRQWDVAGLVTGVTVDEPAINGALWTLWYEALCYGGVAVIVALVPAALRSHVLTAVVAVTWLVVVSEESGVMIAGPTYLPRFGLLFGLGALAWIHADRIRFTPVGLILAATSLAVGVLALGDYRAVGAVGFAYLLVWAIVALPLRVEPPADISYGLYVYHWPVLQVLAGLGATALGQVGMTLVGLVATGLLALASWTWVEAPALAHKNAAWVDADWVEASRSVLSRVSGGRRRGRPPARHLRHSTRRPSRATTTPGQPGRRAVAPGTAARRRF